MTFTLEAKPYELKVEIPGYGIFTIKKLGAGKESEIRLRLNEAQKLMDELNDKYKDIIEKENNLIKSSDEENLKKLRESAGYKEVKNKQSEVNRKLQKAHDFAVDSQLSLWSADNEDDLKKLFDDFSAEQLNSLYRQALDLEKAQGK